jgi:tryptophan-rich sensory protein
MKPVWKDAIALAASLIICLAAADLGAWFTFQSLGTWSAFWLSSRIAAWLLAPYLLWVSFAAVLNYSIWTLNA